MAKILLRAIGGANKMNTYFTTVADNLAHTFAAGGSELSGVNGDEPFTITIVTNQQNVSADQHNTQYDGSKWAIRRHLYIV